MPLRALTANGDGWIVETVRFSPTLFGIPSERQRAYTLCRPALLPSPEAPLGFAKQFLLELCGRTLVCQLDLYLMDQPGPLFQLKPGDTERPRDWTEEWVRMQATEPDVRDRLANL